MKKTLILMAVLAMTMFLFSGCMTRTVVIPAGPPTPASVTEYVDENGVVWIVEYDGPQGWQFSNIWISGVFYPVYWTTDFMFYRSHSHVYHGHGYARHSGRFDHSGHRGYRHHDGTGGGHRNPGHPGPGYNKGRTAPSREGHPGNYRKPSAPTKSPGRNEGIKNAPRSGSGNTRSVPRSAPRKSGGGGNKKSNN